jgi:hypothetical protein
MADANAVGTVLIPWLHEVAEQDGGGIQPEGCEHGGSQK